MISENTYGEAVRLMIEDGFFTEESYSGFQNILMDEFVFMNTLIQDKDICKLYELLRTKSNVFHRMLFGIHLGYHHDKIKPHTIRESLKTLLEV